MLDEMSWMGLNSRRTLLCYLMDTMGQVFNVLGRDASHRDTTVLCQINAEVLAQACALVSVHSSEAEHANLFSDVLPVPCRSQFFLKWKTNLVRL